MNANAMNMRLSDEVIRQCTLINSVRGLLLLRVRNELRMTFAAYQVAYESAIAFGMRTRLKMSVQMHSLNAQRLELKEDIAKLRAELETVEAKCEQIQTDSAAARADDVSIPTSSLLSALTSENLC